MSGPLGDGPVGGTTSHHPRVTIHPERSSCRTRFWWRAPCRDHARFDPGVHLIIVDGLGVSLDRTYNQGVSRPEQPEAAAFGCGRQRIAAAPL